MLVTDKSYNKFNKKIGKQNGAIVLFEFRASPSPSSVRARLARTRGHWTFSFQAKCLILDKLGWSTLFHKQLLTQLKYIVIYTVQWYNKHYLGVFKYVNDKQDCLLKKILLHVIKGHILKNIKYWLIGRNIETNKYQHIFYSNIIL